MRMHSSVTWLTIVAISGLSTVALAQNANPNVNQNRQNATQNRAGNAAASSADQRTAWRNADHFLATCVAISNQEEVAISKFAHSKLKTDDAKEFAKMLIDDHSSFIKKLQEFAPEATREGFLNTDYADRDGKRTTQRQDRDRNQATARNEQKAPATNNAAPNNATQRTAAKPNLDQQHGGVPVDLMQLEREIAEQCLSDSMETLNEKEGDEVDYCFIGMQIAKHASMLSKLEVLQRHASGELRNVLAQGEKTTQEHMDKAIEIMKGLERSSDRKAASK